MPDGNTIRRIALQVGQITISMTGVSDFPARLPATRNSCLQLRHHRVPTCPGSRLSGATSISSGAVPVGTLRVLRPAMHPEGPVPTLSEYRGGGCSRRPESKNARDSLLGPN